jgi:hypothetical protein
VGRLEPRRLRSATAIRPAGASSRSGDGVSGTATVAEPGNSTTCWKVGTVLPVDGRLPGEADRGERDGVATILVSRPFDPIGHFVADATVPPGKTRYDLIAALPDGEVLSTYVVIAPGAS